MTSTQPSLTWRLFNAALYYLSGEWMLANRANGGSVVFLRAALIAASCLVAAVCVRNWIDPAKTAEFDFVELRRELLQALPWASAVFAGAYATLYARFASQWAYLAGVYNSIKAAEVKGDAVDVQKLAEWKAGFIEDASDLHLIRKGIFVSVAKVWGSLDEVKAAYIENTAGGLARFQNDMAAVEEAYRDASRITATKQRRA